ncbi:MAG: DUF5320 domain-containing protein [Proteobacteria bacterium]|nr:DUF5320 domain-containing protein [Pseudomonadota bacterium]
MPGGNGTGPAGTGPLSGRGMGYCAKHSASGFADPNCRPRCGRGLGFGFRRGYDRGRFGPAWLSPQEANHDPDRIDGPSYPAAPTRREEREWLLNEARDVEETLKNIKKRIAELEFKNGED